ncbi:GCN5-related N-acetyltransferase [Minicystis rosea]|nr:GCN5-related N-acetyltransferase [Minicystis rosea]
MTTPATFREDHVLADGTRVTLRFIRPEDAPELRRAFGRLSMRSRYQRFFAVLPELNEDMVRYLTEVDGDRHVAIVATTDSCDLKSEIGLGVARYVCLEGSPGVAEAAVTVVDEAQGKGIGRLLLRALARVARERAVHSFRGTVLADNTRMRHLLTDVGATLLPEDGQTLMFDVPLRWPPESPEQEAEHPLRRLLRAAAESLGLRSPSDAAPAPEPEGGVLAGG